MRHLRILLGVLFCAAGFGAAHGQVLPLLENDFRNNFSQEGAPADPVGDAGPRTGLQFRSGTVFGGWRTGRILDLGGTVVAGAPDTVLGPTTILQPSFIPKDNTGAPLPGQGVRLSLSRLGVPLVLKAVTYPIGGVIPPPDRDLTGAPIPSNYYLPEPANSATSGRFYFSPHAQKVFAADPGYVSIQWKVRATNAIHTKVYTVIGAAVKTPRKIFWTENGFNGPKVAVPDSRFGAVNVVYTPRFTRTVTIPFRPSTQSVPGDPGSQLPLEYRTLWYDTLDKQIHAYNSEGRVLVEYLGVLKPDGISRVHLGFEVVDVIKEIPPTEMRVSIGEKVTAPDGDPALKAAVITGLFGTDKPYLYEHYSLGGTKRTLYSIRKTTPLLIDSSEQQSNEVLIYWEEEGVMGLYWPKSYAGYIFQWPTDPSQYTLYARPEGSPDALATGVQLNSADTPSLIYQDDPTTQQAALTPQNVFYTKVDSTDSENKALIRYLVGDNIWFERVQSQLDTTFPEYSGSGIPVDVGTRIEPPASADTLVGHIRPRTAGGFGTSYNAEAYQDPFFAGFNEAAKGAIIGVNALAGKDLLEVWWFKKNAPPSDKFTGTYWPAFVRKYQLRWPTAPKEIVLARNDGSGDLPSLAAAGKIYFENNAAKPGYNPNEEHALMLNGRAWALRDDLNLATTSQPFVLISYTEADGRPAMDAFQVLREKGASTFSYDASVGKLLQSPMPLPILPLPIRANNTVANEEVQPTAPPDPAPDFNSTRDASYAHYNSFTHIDRKGGHWLYRGPHDGVSNAAKSLRMRYYYKTQPGFYFPDRATQPVVGTIVPYLRPLNAGLPAGDAVNGTPFEVVYQPKWPDTAPELAIGETLALPKNGLPAVRGQSSARVLYEQSVALSLASKPRSVRLHDPTRAKKFALSPVGLDMLPASIATSLYLGKTYFPNLPPHLSKRLYFDPAIGAKGSLVLLGEFEDEPVGEKFFQLNVLTTEDRVSAKGLCAASDTRKTKWDQAVDGLKTTLQTFKEDPARRGVYIPDTTKNKDVAFGELAELDSSNTAVDSYALTASGGGTGFVVMTTGDGAAFTPQGKPVSLHVFKVAAPLYRGELKVVEAANPLDEKLTLQHSGDFAGKPDDYEFAWLYAPPVDGVPPTLYNFTRELLLGDGQWSVLHNPPADFARFREYSADLTGWDTANLPQTSIVIRDGNGTALPQALLRRTFTATSRPLRLYVSLSLGQNDGAIVYLNQAQVAVWNIAGQVDTALAASPGSLLDPLPVLFEIPPGALLPGNNTITVELSTSADAGTFSPVNVRIEGARESATLTDWLELTSGAKPAEAPGLGGLGVSAKSRHTIEGASLLTLTDNYFTMRYRAKAGTPAFTATGGAWSRWMDPQLAEGWIKRALRGINPFQQRVTDLLNNSVDTQVSLLTQAGKRWEGNIALSLESINDFGLVEIYETVLNRGKDLSIDAVVPINYPAANDALILAAGYLNDLYMILGNEAYADGANPTIAYSTNTAAETAGIFGNVVTSLFAFKGQLPSVLEEELALLRGRDDFLQPGTRIAPVYNRLFWNYTRGIDSGEAVYALNYNIKEVTSDGRVDAADAAKLYPQGHGDAYGHYLTALTGYYRLLSSANFDWSPRTEAVTVLGKAVQVDYLDERKFAAAAAALARTASQTLDLTYRQAFTASGNKGWSHLRDGRTNASTGVTRSWGVDDWAWRAGQGALFHWVTANSTLPAVDTNPNHEGIQKIDRTTLPELAEIVAQAATIQTTVDNADARLNPLGLSTGALSFDISPTAVDDGQTHYEQIYERAVGALGNAVSAFDNAKGSTQLLRQQEDNLEGQRYAIADQELAYKNQLIELYGTPYTDDIGPGRTYKQGYDGPDLLHSAYVELPELFANSLEARTYELPLNPAFQTAQIALPLGLGTLTTETTLLNDYTKVTFTLDAEGRFRKPADWTGHRVSPGEIQSAISEVLLAREALRQSLEDHSKLDTKIRAQITVVDSGLKARGRIIDLLNGENDTQTILDSVKLALNTTGRIIGLAEDIGEEAADTVGEAAPTSVGLSVDVGSGVRTVLGAIKLALQSSIGAIQVGLESAAEGVEVAQARLERTTGILIENENFGQENKQQFYELRTSLQELVLGTRAVDAALRGLDQANRDLAGLRAQGDRVLSEREVFRQRTAALIQGYRTKDFAFRAFRNEALEKYRTLFDLASRYTFLAARAYDYETGLLDASGSSSATNFFNKIVRSRAPGVLAVGVPQFAASGTGDPGLAGVLAQMQGDWSVAKTRLGFNNPDHYSTTFSLRTEKNRLLVGAEGDSAWRDVLAAARRENILDDPDVRRYCMQAGDPDGVPMPGFVIEFQTTITPGYNFFGRPLAGGDAGFSPTSFATKIRASGVAFDGYVGMDSPPTTADALAGAGASSPPEPSTGFADKDALSRTPYIYLVPCGVDSMRSPPLGDRSTVRTWSVEDQAIPLPFNIGNTDFSTSKSWQSSDSLSETAFTIRKHQAFRAVPGGTNFSDDPGFTNARLIGRSVWNSRWKIVIPGQTLLNDPNKGMETFLKTVRDIQLHLETYSYSGN